jgi:hypothetical protein
LRSGIKVGISDPIVPIPALDTDLYFFIGRNLDYAYHSYEMFGLLQSDKFNALNIYITVLAGPF